MKRGSGRVSHLAWAFSPPSVLSRPPGMFSPVPSPSSSSCQGPLFSPTNLPSPSHRGPFSPPCPALWPRPRRGEMVWSKGLLTWRAGSQDRETPALLAIPLVFWLPPVDTLQDSSHLWALCPQWPLSYQIPPNSSPSLCMLWKTLLFRGLPFLLAQSNPDLALSLEKMKLPAQFSGPSSYRLGGVLEQRDSQTNRRCQNCVCMCVYIFAIC